MPEILESARKHGLSDDRILHAFNHPIRIVEVDGLPMVIGADQAGRLLELGVVPEDGIDYVVHAMMARRKYLER